MDPFSISVGTLTIVEQCLKSGNVLLKLYDDYRSAEIDVSETLLKLKVIWHKTASQMVFLQKIWHELDANFQQNQHLLLSILQNKLNAAVVLLRSVIGLGQEPGSLDQILRSKATLRRAKYVLRVKDDLESTLSDLMKWRELFDPSWYLLARVPGNEIDKSLASQPEEEAVRTLVGLRKSVRDLNSDTSMPPRPISTNDFLGPRSPITGSSSATAGFEDRRQCAVVDTMLVNSSMDPAGTTVSVKALARALSRMEPFTFGLLRCCGVIKRLDSYDLVLEIPPILQTPRSLRDLLAHRPPSLNVKLNIAKQLANSVLYLHATGFVHKNIRPETILVFDHGEAKASFLVGFENFRSAKDDTFRIGDSLPERELYRHPLRQGNNPERQYVMQHDIYSLGVCLLEIGIWKSFVSVHPGGTVTEFDSIVSTYDWRRRAFGIKKQLLVIADEQLSQHTGKRFKDIVDTCLTCLDDDAAWDTVDEKRAAEIDVGVKFIEDVLLKLQEIVV